MSAKQFIKHVESKDYHYDGWGHWRRKWTGYNGKEWQRFTVHGKWVRAETRDTADRLADFAWLRKKIFRLDCVWVSGGHLVGVDIWDV